MSRRKDKLASELLSQVVCADEDPVRQIDIHLNPTFENLWLE